MQEATTTMHSHIVQWPLSKALGSFLRALLVATACAAGTTAPSQEIALAANENSHTRQPVRITSDFLDAKLSMNRPGFEGLSLDSLGKEHFPLVPMNFKQAAPATSYEATRDGDRVEYRLLGASDETHPCWAIEVGQKAIRLESNWSAEQPPEPLVLTVNQRACHITLLGLMDNDGAVRLPALMHLPDQGSFRISAIPKNAGPLGYDSSLKERLVKITFPAATQERPKIQYRWEVVAIHPEIGKLADNPRFDGFRRNWLNIFQLNPVRRVLANNATSDNCAFCYYEYADLARLTPPLAPGLTACDLIRQTLDAILSGTSAYGMPGHGAFPEFSSDTYPSLLIAANDYVQGSHDHAWLKDNYAGLRSWVEKMLSTDSDGDGLIEYTMSGNSGIWQTNRPRYRPANWWDTIGFGHHDAYANALAYRALLGMEKMAGQAKQKDDAERYGEKAKRLHAAYFKTFYNPDTGVLAGWRSTDGELHDYYFLWLNGIAIRYGLVEKEQANAIMDRLLTKLKEVGYTRFDMGLPGNLIPVRPVDYYEKSHRWGGSTNANGSDGFQVYENGGATGCFAYFTLAALYDLGRIEDGDAIFMPMLDSYATGGFQGFCDNGRSKDWRMWDGYCWGYEGFLVDNYYALMAVLDREAALGQGSKPAPSQSP